MRKPLPGFALHRKPEMVFAVGEFRHYLGAAALVQCLCVFV
jgi:hypothetical protein